MTHWFRRSWRFQSTLPARGATHLLQPIGLLYRNFNPRSPHGERRRRTAFYPRSRHFNPRSPHGERQGKRSFSVQAEYFNPRSPHGERRRRTRPEGFCPRISIHAPRTGSDAAARRRRQSRAYFNPRSPHGERPRHGSRADSPAAFQSTLPARGATVRGGRVFPR